jgi:phage gp46-like protein
MPLDIALAFDPVNNRCDLVFDGRDFAVDTTYQTPVLMSLGCDRRAHPDDPLPNAQTTLSPPVSPLNPKRGWAGDALDARGELTGSRGWVLSRAKHLETTRQLALSIDTEALAWLNKRAGVSMTIAVEWLSKNFLAHRIQIGQTKITVKQVVGL